MTVWEYVLLWGYIVCQTFIPIPYFVWVWRRTGSWRRLAVAAFVVVPAVSYLVGGFVGMSVVMFRAIVWDEDLSAEGTGAANGKALFMWFSMFGCGGVCSNCLGLFLSVPLFAVWRFAHRKSFTRVTGHRD